LEWAANKPASAVFPQLAGSAEKPRPYPLTRLRILPIKLQPVVAKFRSFLKLPEF
jgi:hypothetical protein